VNLLLSAWHQRPAASIPDDPEHQAALAGLSRGASAMRTWSKIPMPPSIDRAGHPSGGVDRSHGQSIRLNGIDTPERGARCGDANIYQQAALALSEHIGTRTVTCEISGRDRYQRAIGTCSVAGSDVAACMVSNGWARDWPRYSGGRYATHEQVPRARGLGVWNAACPTTLWGNRSYAR
jgi:endonuclease YncB( thermonuclease family)